MKKVLKAIGKAVKVIFIVFFVFLVSLCFRQQRLPDFIVARVCERLSSDRIVVSISSASFGFRHGVDLVDVRIYDRQRRDNLVPMFSAEEISVWFVLRTVEIVEARFPRLHDGYYGIPSENRGRQDAEPEAAGTNALSIADVELPQIPSFTLRLIRPEILGVAPDRVVAEVNPLKRKVELYDIHLDWPDQDSRMWLDGSCTLDFGGGFLEGEVHGTAKQEHIRPLLLALDLPSSYPYMGGYPDTGVSGFTAVPGPVPASCAWRYDFAQRDFRIDIDVHPDMGRYNDIRLQRVDGKLGVHTKFHGDTYDYHIEVGPLVATDLRGRTLRGWMTVHGTNDLNYLEFDAFSNLEKQDTLDIMGYLNRGTLDAFKCLTPPSVSAKGVFNCDDVNIRNNDMGGRVEVAQCELSSLPLTDLSMDYRLRADEIVFTNMTAKAFTGGDTSGWARFHLPIADGDESGFYGEGSLTTIGGRIAKVPLFLALTDALAENVPGVDKVVNQSDTQCEFTLSNGVFRTDHFVVQGALFCIKLNGSCDLSTGALDMVAHCTVMKEESTLGKYLIQPMLWPFTKLLTEFHVTGTVTDPVLRNTSVNRFTQATRDILNKVFD